MSASRRVGCREASVKRSGPGAKRERDGTWLATFSAAAALSILLAMTIGTAVLVGAAMIARSQERFETFVGTATEIVAGEMRRSLTELAAIEGLFRASREVTREEFEAFAATLDRRGFAVQALGYIPRVTPEGAEAFNSLVREQGWADYDLLATGLRDEYYPVAFTFPSETGIVAVGEDLHLRAAFRDALRESAAGGDDLVATAPTRTGPGPSDQAAFVVFAPVREGAVGAGSDDAPVLAGFGLGIYRVGDFLAGALERAGVGDVRFRVVDRSPTGTVDEIYPEPGGESASAWPAGYVAVGAVEMAGREWEFRFLSPPDYGLSRLERNAWTIALAAGLSLAFIATWSMYTLVASRRAVRSHLQLMNARLRVVLDAALEGILLVDRDRRVVWANQAYADAFGSGRAEDLIGREWPEAAGAMGSRWGDEGAYLARIEAVHGDETLAVASEDVELVEPSPRTLSMTSVPVTDEDGLYLGRLWVYRDVTSERAADRAKSAFVSMVSHELRTPLTSMTGFVDLAMDGVGGPVSDGMGRLLRTAQANGKRLETLVRDILEVSRLESGPPMNLEAVALRPLVAEVADSLARDFQARGHALSLEVPESLPEAWADRSRVGQIVTNLLTNACRYTPEGGRVTVTGRPGAGSGEAVELSVEDTGIGIPEEHLGRIFDRFVRVDSGYPRPQGSTGLGLSITKTLVELMGGSVKVESAEGVGSTFTVTLPAAGTQAETDEAA